MADNMAVCRPALGVVVVGVGIAGRVRIRDLQQCTCGLALKGFVSRRELDIPGASQVTLKDALASEDVEGLIICTEPESHEEYIRQALDSGKHVLVEYPVAMSSVVARDLYSKAAEKGLIVHEENIGLLTDSHKKLKELATTHQLKSGAEFLTGKYNGWVEKPALEGKPFLGNIAAIQSFYDVFGDFKAVSTTLNKSDDSVEFSGEFVTNEGSKELVIGGKRCRENVQRSKSTIVKFMDGELFDSANVKSASTGPTKPGLFMQDLVIFAEKIRKERPTDADVAMSVRSLEIAEEAHAFLK